MADETRTILAVLAHPDDETFGMGGTLALYAQSGVSAHLVCATRGEVGMVDPHYLQGFASIAERRAEELRCAADKLGLNGVHFLDYRDSGMPGSPDNHHPQALAAASQEEVARKVADWIRKLQPQVVLTFDPIGGYKHPDHIAIHNATVRAFSLAGDPAYVSDLAPFQAQKLYYQVVPKRFLRVALWIMPILGTDPRRFGRNHDVDLTSLVVDGNFPTHAWIDYRQVVERKNAAFLCHASQLDGGPARLSPMRWFQKIAGSKEYYMRAIPLAPPGLKEYDLFAGI
jgi:N-acetyl-1-D-myo-inositol-2-amino-2-deoxy-alpha-D-glucopyranoside deacetylase